MNETLIGVVTVTYNSEGVLPDFLRSMTVQKHVNFILFAIDNASCDKTIDLLRECGDSRLVVIANPDNRGIAEGNNQGIRLAIEAGCSSVLLLNNDTAFDETLLEKLSAGLQRCQCDMICPKILHFDRPDRIWAAGGFFQPRLGYRALHYGEGEIDRGQFDESRKVTFTPACCVLIRTELFAKIGLMDARYFVYAEDTDFMYRALKAGYTLFYQADARLFHKVSRLTGGPESPFTIRYAVRNQAFFALKHFGGIKARFWIAVHRLYYLGKLLSSRDSLAVFRMKQTAINEAFHMPTNDLQS